MAANSGDQGAAAAATAEELRVPVETVAQDPQVYDIEATGKTFLEPPLTAQEEMTRQISRLWELHANFQGLSDYDSQSEATDASSEKDVAREETDDLDAYAVRAKVHEQLLMAQSEIQVSLDMVRLIVAAKKRATRDAVAAALQSSATSKLVKHHDQPPAGLPSLAADSDMLDQVTVGGLPFPVGILDTIRTDAAHVSGDATQKREDELKLVLGAKYRQLDAAANTLQASSQRLKGVTARESVFWRTAFELRRRNWMVQQQRQVMGPHHLGRSLHGYADRYFVRYGYADAGSSFADDSLAELIRDTATGDHNDSDEQVGDSPSAMDVDDAESAPVVPLYIQRSDTRNIQVRLNSTYKQPPASVPDSAAEHAQPADDFANNGEFIDDRNRTANAYDQAHHRLLRARRALFDRELYYRLCKEARVLELGSVRASARRSTVGSQTAVHDTLVTTLSRDDVAVRFEWILDDSDAEQDSNERKDVGFMRWQCCYYARLALVMAAMHQRHVHRVVKDYYLGHGLGTLVSTGGARGSNPPDAFVAVHSAAVVGSSAMLGGSPSAAAPGSLIDEHSGSSAKAAAAPGATSSSSAGGSGKIAAASVSGGSGTSPATPATPSASESAVANAVPPGSSSNGPNATSAMATSGGTTFAVARPDLLILAPVLQSVQFAKWQHILSATIQRACAAWQRLVEEPIEVVSHFSRIYRTPAAETSSQEWNDFCATGNLPVPGSADEYCQGMCYIVRLRFLGGTVMVFRVDAEGSLIFAKGYYPPPVPATAKPDSQRNSGEGGSVLWSRPEQMFIHRVFRIVPLSGLGDFVDQLRRELQSLVLLRVAAALSRRNYHSLRNGRKCQMGQWYVHQSQLCVVGEWWEGARNRQIVGVAKWGGAGGATNRPKEEGAPVDGNRGLGDASRDWDLSLYF
ncbi:hypothetical protein LPJ59_003879, partial [Coemansia sp. RSA 2399]